MADKVEQVAVSGFGDERLNNVANELVSLAFEGEAELPERPGIETGHAVNRRS